MTLDTARTRRYLKEFDFESLFIEELGWDHYTTSLDVEVDEQRFTLQAVAEKRGVVAFTCAVGTIPPYATRRKIDGQVARSFREHFIIYVDGERTEQIWQWVRREIGRPLASREHHYTIQQPGDSLIQKLQTIAFSFEEEETLILVDVTGRVRAAFNVEQATRRFYDRFKSERDAFQKFLEGIPDEETSASSVEPLERWYVSVMLNRLMFIYFIQKKGFLDGDPDYLRHKLAQSQETGFLGKNPVSPDRFYRDFLCPLFFEGFARTPEERSPQVRALLGDIPFLNGGIFQQHEVEQLNGRTIRIPDAAFERLFDFFDDYQWHLDDRPLRDDNEINPDVLGYIFEKYINQKQMGAYYTKEDITGYISKNTVIPFLFDQAREKCRVAFEGEPSVWSLLAADPDRYIYEAVRKGTELALPPEIAAGIDDVSQRGAWNTPTPQEYALPTEIWRETVARRQRYEEIRNQVFSKNLVSINDLITYNLDIQQFAQDVIENCEGPELLRAFWRAINQVTVLDPTCGSGAFLFAALNILEPLYEACLQRMEAFVAELAHGDHHPHKYRDFREVLEQMERHSFGSPFGPAQGKAQDRPNRSYFVLKSIVVNNLYGVDIMAEAVEIAKLRLFLKLVAQVDRVENIEPLPDIDFNIRAGNTLVGFTTIAEVEQAMKVAQSGQAKLMFGEDVAALQRIEEKAADVDRLFGKFQAMQTAHDMREYTQDSIETKEELRKRLKALEDELNRYLAQEYGVDVTKPAAYQKWLASHQPFHWFTEFYGILKQGGFDVIIGNPPYVSTRKINYAIRFSERETFPDLYAYALVRSIAIAHAQSRLGMIIPLSVTFSGSFSNLRERLCSVGAVWFSSFDNIPAAIFNGVSQRCSIWLGHKTEHSELFVGPMYRWRASYRPVLTSRIIYTAISSFVTASFGIPKLANPLHLEVLRALQKSASEVDATFSATRFGDGNCLKFSQSARNYISVFFEEPPRLDAKTLKPVKQSMVGEVRFADHGVSKIALAILSGEVYFWYWLTRGDGFHVTKQNITDFTDCIGSLHPRYSGLLTRLGALLHVCRFEALVFKKNAGMYVGSFNYRSHCHITRRVDLLFVAALGLKRTHAMSIFSYAQRVLSINVYAGEKGIPNAVKEKFSFSPIDGEEQQSLFDQVDAALKDYYGFTDEELDFIINYDIKYRMGDQLLEEESEEE